MRNAASNYLIDLVCTYNAYEKREKYRLLITKRDQTIESFYKFIMKQKNNKQTVVYFLRMIVEYIAVPRWTF